MEIDKTADYVIFTDGACSGNPGRGGWSALIVNIRSEAGIKLSGGALHTTNNQMELMACIKSLESLEKPSKVQLHSDSAYIVNCINDKWYVKWQGNGWKTRDKKAVRNAKLWQRLLKACKEHDVEFVHVKGHSDIPGNVMADELAVESRDMAYLRC